MTKPRPAPTLAQAKQLYLDGQARDGALRKAQLASGLIRPDQPTKGACGAAQPRKDAT